MNATEIPRIRGLLRQQRFAEALSSGLELLQSDPGHRDALLLTAVAQRQLKLIPEALRTLAVLESRHPNFSRLHEERGQCHVFMRQAEPAIESLERAVNLNHALPSSWRLLEGLYGMTGQTANAAMAASHVQTLQNLPREIVTATGLFEDGDLDVAEPMVRGFLLQHGDHIEAMRLLARIGIRRRVLDDAELLLAAVLERVPDYRVARREYAGVLIDQHKYAPARRELERLLEAEPEDRVLKTLYATSIVGLGQHERAIGLYRELLQGTADDADLHLWIAHALKTLGRREEAIDSYRRAADCRADFGDAYWSLANLKTYRFTDEELERLRAAEAAPGTADVDRYHLCFALAKALEDRGEFAESFRYYELGNTLKLAESNYRPEIVENNTQRQIEVCSADFFTERKGWGAADPDPIFIVGLPRAGSTLLEQILASHSAVEGTQELANVHQIVQQLRGRDVQANAAPRYPRILERLRPEDFTRLGERYLAETRIYRSGKPFFIDKMPNNFRHVGLIHLMLPNARIIDARREPLACCFSNFKQLFANGQEFTYGIDNIARYYRTYLELMSHWNRVLPRRILRVQHEDVVDDLEGSVRRILDFCGLEFEPTCLKFHETERSVRTASSEQVRQPLYRDGLDQWKHFEPWLEPLKTALGDAVHRYRDD
jgi:tetratricopeptide (TPR) repeat protein